MTSLSKHLTLSLALSLVCFFLLQTVLVGTEMRQLAEARVIAGMQDDMEGLLADLIAQPDALTSSELTQAPDIFKRPFSGHYLQSTQDKQSIHSRSLWDFKLPEFEAGTYSGVSGPENQQLIILCQDYVLHGEKLSICVAEDTSELDATTLHIQKRLLFLSFGVLLLLLLIQVWVIRRGLKPLLAVRRELQQLERGETDKLRHAVPAEISPLVEEVNHLLTVLQQRLQRSRNAMGNLSHALKTPLTLIFQILERRQDDKDSIQLLKQAHHIQDHINRELSRARTAGLTPGGVGFCRVMPL